MADWTGQISETANARGVWMRASSLIEHIPSFPGEIDELDAPSESDFGDTEITDTTSAPVAGRNRGPITDPPPPQRVARPAPAPLFDEAPDATEVTPPTWDMGLLPATYADAEVTEEGENAQPQRADLSFIARNAAIAADQEASVTLELLDDWMEHVDQLDIEAPQQELLPIPPGGSVAPHHRAPQHHAPAASAPLAARAPAPRSAARNRLAQQAPATNRANATPAAATRRHPSTPMMNRSAFDSRAVTRPLARPPVEIRPLATPEPAGAAFESAGWWAAGALSGMIGASVLASLAFAVALLV